MESLLISSTTYLGSLIGFFLTGTKHLLLFSRSLFEMLHKLQVYSSLMRENAKDLRTNVDDGSQYVS